MIHDFAFCIYYFDQFQAADERWLKSQFFSIASLSSDAPKKGGLGRGAQAVTAGLFGVSQFRPAAVARAVGWCAQ